LPVVKDVIVPWTLLTPKAVPLAGKLGLTVAPASGERMCIDGARPVGGAVDGAGAAAGAAAAAAARTTTGFGRTEGFLVARTVFFALGGAFLFGAAVFGAVFFFLAFTGAAFFAAGRFLLFRTGFFLAIFLTLEVLSHGDNGSTTTFRKEAAPS
jgi:hypothetical protein